MSQRHDRHNAVILWLHGLGSCGADLRSIVDTFPELQHPAIRHEFPNAPMRPVTANNQLRMRAWYDLLTFSFDSNAREDHQGLIQACNQVQSWLAEYQAAGIAPERIMLAGFSQGAALSLYTALHTEQRLGGILALSGYLPMMRALNASHTTTTPIFMAHGDADEIIPMDIAERSYQRLQQQHCSITFHRYAMAHDIIAEEIIEIHQFLAQQLCLPLSPT
jgi:phospholipase/carboxylesterase